MSFNFYQWTRCHLSEDPFSVTVIENFISELMPYSDCFGKYRHLIGNCMGNEPETFILPGCIHEYFCMSISHMSFLPTQDIAPFFTFQYFLHVEECFVSFLCENICFWHILWLEIYMLYCYGRCFSMDPAHVPGAFSCQYVWSNRSAI